MQPRDEFVRQLWLAGFEFREDLPAAQLFIRSSDSARVLVPKREGGTAFVARVDEPANESASPVELSPCCGAESRLRRILNGMIYFRCTACTYIWDRPAARRPTLRVVK